MITNLNLIPDKVSGSVAISNTPDLVQNIAQSKYQSEIIK